MPKLTFDDSNRKQTESFPKLKLDTGERVKIAVFADPHAEYVHNLRAPKLVNGKPQMETKKRRDGTSYEDFQMDFINNPICLGDFDVLEDRGVDPTNCPACAAAKDSDAMTPPKRRFAMPVIRYVNLKNASFELGSPFSIKIEVWAFTDERFNKLTEIKNEWADSGGLKTHDLNLGPCSDKNFQKYDISISQRAEWSVDQSRKQMVKDAIEGQVPDDLSNFCGRKVARKYMEEDVERVLNRWRVVNGQEPTSDPLSKVESASVDFEGILSNAAAANTKAAKSDDVPFDTRGSVMVKDEEELDLNSIISGFNQ